MISFFFQKLSSASYSALAKYKHGGAPRWRGWIAESCMFSAYWVYENFSVPGKDNARALIGLSNAKAQILIQYGLLPAVVDELRDAIKHDCFSEAGSCCQKGILFNLLAIALFHLGGNPEPSLIAAIREWEAIGDNPQSEFARQQLAEYHAYLEHKSDAFRA